MVNAQRKSRKGHFINDIMAVSKVELQVFCHPESLPACQETKHFHSSFGPRVIFLLEKMENLPYRWQEK